MPSKEGRPPGRPVFSFFSRGGLEGAAPWCVLGVLLGKKVPPPTPQGREGRLFPPRTIFQNFARSKLTQCQSQQFFSLSFGDAPDGLP